jgi:hypothetical protein
LCALRHRRLDFDGGDRRVGRTIIGRRSQHFLAKNANVPRCVEPYSNFSTADVEHGHFDAAVDDNPFGPPRGTP